MRVGIDRSRLSKDYASRDEDDDHDDDTPEGGETPLARITIAMDLRGM